MLRKQVYTVLGKTCMICGDAKVQMHHVRQLRSLRARLHLDWFTMQMAAINGKQVPLCADHHKRLHHNSLTLPYRERDLFAKGCPGILTSR